MSEPKTEVVMAHIFQILSGRRPVQRGDEFMSVAALIASIFDRPAPSSHHQAVVVSLMILVFALLSFMTS